MISKMISISMALLLQVPRSTISRGEYHLLISVTLSLKMNYIKISQVETFHVIKITENTTFKNNVFQFCLQAFMGEKKSHFLSRGYKQQSHFYRNSDKKLYIFRCFPANLRDKCLCHLQLSLELNLLRDECCRLFNASAGLDAYNL